MKYLLNTLILISILVGACSKDGLKSALDDSRDAWLSFKKANNNSYSYTVASSSWTGFSSTTTIVVTNGVASERIYKQYSVNGSNGQTQLTKSWSEDKTSLNSHQECAATWTLDEVYDKAENVWLRADEANNTLYFETQNNGMISLCGYVPKGCQDDCLTGIHISEIKPLVNGKYVAGTI